MKTLMLRVRKIFNIICISHNISNMRDGVSLGYPNTKKRVENTMYSGVFLTKFEVLDSQGNIVLSV